MPNELSTAPDAAGAALRALGAIGFIGAGAAGGTLARALAARGARVAAVTARHEPAAIALAASIPGCRAVTDPAEVVAAARVIVLAVPDDAIVALDALLPWRASHTVAHLSGARGIAALARAQAAGAGVAALHPLMLFPRPTPDAPTALARLAGCAWALEAGSAETAARMETIVAALAGHTIRIGSDDRVPYHLAAVLVSNYVVALAGGAVALWEGFGVQGDAALAALLPLLRATVENLERLGPIRALTGPVARGDGGTIAAHLAWLAEQAATPPASISSALPASVPVASPADAPSPPIPLDHTALLDAYRALARLAIPLAQARGSLDSAAATPLRELLRRADVDGPHEG